MASKQRRRKFGLLRLPVGGTSTVLALSWTEKVTLHTDTNIITTGVGSYASYVRLGSEYFFGPLATLKLSTIQAVLLGATFSVNNEPLFPAPPMIQPRLVGTGWPLVKTPNWQNYNQESITGVGPRMSQWSYPQYKFKVPINVLNPTDLQQYVGFFLGRQGRDLTFLFDDESDDAVTNMVLIPTADGATTIWQLTRTVTVPASSQGDTFVTYTEPVVAPKPGSVTMFVNGVSATATVNPYGLATFAQPPPGGATISWTGGFYFRCRFLQDLTELDRFVYNLYAIHQIEFETTKQ